MKTYKVINEDDIEAITRLVEYLEDTESEDFEEWKESACSELGDSHIMQSVMKVREMLNTIEKK